MFPLNESQSLVDQEPKEERIIPGSAEDRASIAKQSQVLTSYLAMDNFKLVVSKQEQQRLAVFQFYCQAYIRYIDSLPPQVDEKV